VESPSKERLGAAPGGGAEARVTGTGEWAMGMADEGSASSLRIGESGTSGRASDGGSKNRIRLDGGGPIGGAILGRSLGDGDRMGELEAEGQQTGAKSLTAPSSADRKSMEGEQRCGPCQGDGSFSFCAGARYSAKRADSLPVCLRWSPARGQLEVQ
jgi:hypothetical protein